MTSTNRPRGLRTALLVAVAMALAATAAVAAGDPTPTPPPKIAVVARGDGANFADALAVGSVAGQLGAPVFTTTPTSLPEATATALSEYAPELVIIPGGTAAVSSEVETAIGQATDLPPSKVVRAAGNNRYETAAAIAAIFEDQGIDPAYLPTGAKAVDADLLDGKDASAFAGANHKHDGRYLRKSQRTAVAGAEQDATSAIDLAGTIKTIVETSITAPTDGYLLVTGATTLANHSETQAADVACKVRVDGEPDQPIHFTNTLDTADLADPANPVIDRGRCADTVVVPVSAGAHTFSMVAGGPADSFASEGALSAVFTPFGM